jgi:hypothetical protein
MSPTFSFVQRFLVRRAKEKETKETTAQSKRGEEINCFPNKNATLKQQGNSSEKIKIECQRDE